MPLSSITGAAQPAASEGPAKHGPKPPVEEQLESSPAKKKKKKNVVQTWDLWEAGAA